MDPTDRILTITRALLYAQLSSDARRLIVERELVLSQQQSGSTTQHTMNINTKKLAQCIGLIQQDIEAMLHARIALSIW